MRLWNGCFDRNDGRSGDEPPGAESAAASREGEECDLSAHAWRREPRGYVRPETGADEVHRQAVVRGSREDYQDEFHSRSFEGHSARQSVGVSAGREERAYGFRSLSEPSRYCGRSARAAWMLFGSVRSRSGDLSSAYRTSASGTALPRLLAHLWTGNGASESAGVRCDVGRIHQVRPSRV